MFKTSNKSNVWLEPDPRHKKKLLPWANAGLRGKLAIVLLLCFFNLNSRSDSGLRSGSVNLDTEEQLAFEPIKILPAQLRLDAAKVALGKQLFEDKALSMNNSVSCSSCHSFLKGGADGRKKPVGMNAMEGMLNTPTVFNSSLNFKQFWDGRANSLEEQIEGPLLNPGEMGATWESVLTRLSNSQAYTRSFQSLYPDGVQRKNVKNAIAEFERSLATPNARFDRFLSGEKNAISASEKRGYAKFKSFGCSSCHQGANVGGNMFQMLGTVADYFEDRGNVTKADLGRYNVTGDVEDKHVFKVPSLRNVELTAPYFHDGMPQTLPEAVQLMGKYQLGRSLSDEDIADIVLFLKTLTGEYQGRHL